MTSPAADTPDVPTVPAVRDSDIRRLVHAQLATRHTHEPNTMVLDELGICCGDARCDIAVVNGDLCGYEIKSDVDRIDRLEGQIARYEQVFDFSTVVSGERLIAKVEELAPAHWGIWLCARDGEALHLEYVRDAQRNIDVDVRSLAQLLWRDELMDELRNRGAHVGLSRKARRHVWDRACDTFERDELRGIVRDRLRARGDWRRGASALPGTRSVTARA